MSFSSFTSESIAIKKSINPIIKNVNTNQKEKKEYLTKIDFLKDIKEIKYIIEQNKKKEEM